MIRFLTAWLWMTARLPLPWVHILGTVLGRLVWRFSPAIRKVVCTNLALAWPEQDAAWRARLGRRVLEETGKSLLELGHLWMLPPHKAQALVREIHGQEFLDEALSHNRGLLLAIPHLGAWEMMAVHFGLLGSCATLYRPPRKDWLHPLIRRARSRAGAELIPADRKAVRSILRALKQGKSIGILPDQQPKAGDGVFAPFLGHPAWTMTLLPRLHQRTGTPLLFGAVVRLPRGRGYAMHFRRPEPPLTGEDVQQLAAAMNENVAWFVRQWPEQYQWTYKRWSIQPEGVPSPYGHRDES